MSALFRQDNHGNHLVLWNTNPTRRNALSPEYYDGLLACLRDAAETREIAAVILAGEGNYFCSGGDLNMLKARREMDLDERYANINRLQGLIRAIRDCPKPVISAVEGGAAGAGLSIALACDLVVSARSASYTLAYVKVGLVPDGGATYTLLKALPKATVAKMALLGYALGAERLFELGMISELADDGKALDIAQSLASRLAAGPEQAISSIKSLMNQGQAATLDEQLDAECKAMAEALGGDEAQIGISALLNKTKPAFRT